MPPKRSTLLTSPVSFADFVCRVAFFFSAPFAIVVVAQLFPVGGALLDVGLALVVFIETGRQGSGSRTTCRSCSCRSSSRRCSCSPCRCRSRRPSSGTIRASGVDGWPCCSSSACSRRRSRWATWRCGAGLRSRMRPGNACACAARAPAAAHAALLHAASAGQRASWGEFDVDADGIVEGPALRAAQTDLEAFYKHDESYAFHLWASPPGAWGVTADQAARERGVTPNAPRVPSREARPPNAEHTARRHKTRNGRRHRFDTASRALSFPDGTLPSPGNYVSEWWLRLAKG